MSERLARVLYIDLTARETSVASRPELFARYLGGTGVASKLLLEECPPNVDPFSPEAPIILATGPLVGLFPSMARCVATFKSPLTGNLGESHAGGCFSTALRFADYGAIVIKGSSDKPVSLIVGNDSSRIENAAGLWGLSPLQVDEALRPHVTEDAQSVMSIGRAGENRIHYAGAIVDRYHHFGRLGLGAVMGSKKLKAIYVHGTDQTHHVKQAEFEDMYNETHRRVVTTDLMKKYQQLGTAANVLELNELRALPSKNFSKSTCENAENISGERFADEILERKVSCPGCPVACVHLGTVSATGELRGEGALSHEKLLVPYNYEPIFALGINLGVGDPKGVMGLISQCDRLGLDSIMTGAVLGWATEAYEKRLITADETMGLQPIWGHVESYSEMIENIACAQNQFYAAMGRGVAAVAEKYGGKGFAISLGKNSPAGYFTGYGSVVGTLVGARHSHLSNSGYNIDQTAMTKTLSPLEIVEFLVEEEDWLNVLNSLVACYFSRDVYDKELVVRALATVGIEQKKDDLMRLGREISRNLYSFKIREGFDLTKERIPKRLLKLESPLGFLNRETIQQMISHYARIREDEDQRLEPGRLTRN